MIATCHLYHLEVYARLASSFLSTAIFANIAIKPPGDLSWSPIPTELLYLNKPGSRNLHFNLTKNITPHISLGSNLVIKGNYFPLKIIRR
ncbi:hypothetical protein AC249_AIPGENE9834 [Exaiptasia diaphana]|nr:hypothetical protein AC249_AIPGENE9834 [Exaiptasia diaphana]